MERGYQVKIFSNAVLNNDIYEITDDVFVPTLTDAVNLVSLLANMNKDIMSVEIKETFNFDEGE